ncbi:hypothetical protein TNCV_3865871 [Trichonephila clavipes]|nr:hypothetical protein TNCV_3865871 [Trichonephila clavipes]
MVSGSQIPWHNFRYPPYLKQHITYVRDKFRRIMFKLFTPNRPELTFKYRKQSASENYTAVMRPILAYASPVWGYAAKTNINKLDTLQNSLIRMIVSNQIYAQ